MLINGGGTGTDPGETTPPNDGTDRGGPTNNSSVAPNTGIGLCDIAGIAVNAAMVATSPFSGGLTAVAAPMIGGAVTAICDLASGSLRSGQTFADSASIGYSSQTGGSANGLPTTVKTVERNFRLTRAQFTEAMRRFGTVPAPCSFSNARIFGEGGICQKLGFRNHKRAAKAMLYLYSNRMRDNDRHNLIAYVDGIRRWDGNVGDSSVSRTLSAISNPALFDIGRAVYGSTFQVGGAKSIALSHTCYQCGFDGIPTRSGTLSFAGHMGLPRARRINTINWMRNLTNDVDRQWGVGRHVIRRSSGAIIAGSIYKIAGIPTPYPFGVGATVRALGYLIDEWNETDLALRLIADGVPRAAAEAIAGIVFGDLSLSIQTDETIIDMADQLLENFSRRGVLVDASAYDQVVVTPIRAFNELRVLTINFGKGAGYDVIRETNGHIVGTP